LTRATPFSGMVGRPKANTRLDITCKHTKFYDVPDIFQGSDILE